MTASEDRQTSEPGPLTRSRSERGSIFRADEVFTGVSNPFLVEVSVMNKRGCASATADGLRGVFIEGYDLYRSATDG